MTILQFTLAQHPSSGGIYETQRLFQKVLGSKIVEVVPSNLSGKTEGDYQINPKNLIAFKQLIVSLNELEVELIIIHSLFSVHSILGYWIAKNKNIPYFFVPHGTLDPYVFSYRYLRKYMWMNLIGNKIIQQAHTVICSSNKEAEKASIFLSKARVEICPWSVEVPQIKITNESKIKLKKDLAINLNKHILLFMGRIHSLKRPLETAIAFQKLQASSWTLLIVGVPEDQELLEQVKQYCDGENIIYHPPVYGREKWQFIAAADGFVSFSHRENFGRSVVEAAALGVPLLIGQGIDIYRVFEQAGGADIVEIKTQSDIEQSLQSFLDKSPVQLQEMGKKAQQVFQQQFSERGFSQRLLSLVETRKS